MNYLWCASNLVMNRLFIELNICFSSSSSSCFSHYPCTSRSLEKYKKCPLLSISNQHGVLHKYLQLWNCVKIAALLRDANQVDKSLLSNVTVFSSNFAFVYISNVILISLSRQENLGKEMNESNNQLVLDEFV